MQTTLSSDASPARPASDYRQWFQHEPVFSATALFLAALTVLLLLALLIDSRSIQAENVWLKPLKFSVAIGVYLMTLALYARWLPNTARSNRWYQRYVKLIAVSAVLEMLWIGGAAMVGSTSHFNISSPLMTVLYTAAGVFAVTLTSASLVYGVLIGGNRDLALPVAVRWSLGLGLISTAVLTVIVAGYLSGNGSHFVGTPAAGDMGSSIMGWSRTVGDLRVSHFFGTHALHVIPFGGLLISRWFAPNVAKPSVVGLTIVYSAFVMGVFWQALAGQPFL